MKKNIPKALKKHKLKPVAIIDKKEKNSGKNDKNSDKKQLSEELEKPEENEQQKQSSFHETILEESIDFPAPVLKAEEEEDKKEAKETLEETAAASPIQITSPNTNGTAIQNAYQTGLTSSTYTGNTTTTSSSSYQSNTSVNPFLEKDNRERGIFGVPQPTNADNFRNSENEFQAMQEKYKSDRESSNRPWEPKRKRHEIW